MLLQITSKKLESHLRHANAIRRLSMKKKNIYQSKNQRFQWSQGFELRLLAFHVMYVSVNVSWYLDTLPESNYSFWYNVL